MCRMCRMEVYVYKIVLSAEQGRRNWLPQRMSQILG